MSISAEVLEVTTADAAPTTAPFKISGKATKSALTFKVKITSSNTIRAIRARFKPTNRISGKLLYSRGMVCGSGDRCGSATAFSLVHSSPMTTGTVTLNDSEVSSEPDGEYEVKAWGASEEDGWSS